MRILLENNDDNADESKLERRPTNSWDGDRDLSTPYPAAPVPTFLPVAIEDELFQNLSSEHTDSLKSFVDRINELLNYCNVPPESVKPLQETINEFVKESGGISYDQRVLKSKFIHVVEHVLRLLPKTLTIAAFTLLAPFSKQIGEPIQYLVEAIQKETTGPGNCD